MKKLAIVFFIFLSYLSIGQKKPNIILILADDLGYGEYSYDNPTRWSTPNIDSLFREGCLFRRFYVHENCSPTRTQLLTGRYHFRTALNINTTKVFENRTISYKEKLISSYLKDYDYSTAFFGKWHLGNSYEWQSPHARGFDECKVMYSGNPDGFFTYTNLNIPDYVYNGELITNVDRTRYLTYTQTDDCINFINTASKDTTRPFFIYLPYNDPHAPMDADPALLAIAPNNSNARPQSDVNDYRKLWAKIKALDNGVGDIRNILRQKGIEDNTLIIFLSDNGAVFANGGDSGNLKGEKGDFYEGGINTKCVFYWKGKITPKVIPRNSFGTVLDILPTLIEGVLGNTPIYKNKLDGENIWNTIINGVPSRSNRYHIVDYFPDRWWVVIKGNYKASNRLEDITAAFPETSLVGYTPVYRDVENPYVAITAPEKPYLADVVNDSTEQFNIYASNLAIYTELENYVLTYRDSTNFNQSVVQDFNTPPSGYTYPAYWGDFRQTTDPNYYWNRFIKYTYWDGVAVPNPFLGVPKF